METWTTHARFRIRTSIVPVALVRAIQFTNDSIGTHNCLKLDGVMPFVPREIVLLSSGRSAYGSCRPVDEAPAVAERRSLVVHRLLNRYKSYVLRRALGTFW